MNTYVFIVRRVHEIDVDIEAETYEEAIEELKKVNIAQEEIERPNCVEEVVMNEKGEVIEDFFFDAEEWEWDASDDKEASFMKEDA